MGKKNKGKKRKNPSPAVSVNPTSGKKARAYAGAGGNVGRLVYPVHSSSADAEMHTSLRALRDRSRALRRDNVTARRARRVAVNNVVGQGIGMQPQVRRARDSRQMKTINAGIERAWRAWSAADSCHTGGELPFSDLERLLYGEKFEAGEVFVRLHRRPFGRSAVPLALEVIEAERLADDWEISSPRGASVDLGIERDAFGRPAFYFFHSRHPNEFRKSVTASPDEIIEVPAADIIHLRTIERWPQSRGEPALHAAVLRLDQSDQFDHAALTAAVVGASKVGFYEPTEDLADDEALLEEGDPKEADGTPMRTIKAGSFEALPYGYRFTSFDPQYPHEVYEPFVRAADRKIAAGTDTPYEELTQDYSQSNYSSARMSHISARDNWRSEQQWLIRALRERLHAEWLQAAVLARAIPEISIAQYVADPARFEAVKWKPRGWQSVDPQKEIKAMVDAVDNQFMTLTDVLAQWNGGTTLEEYIETRRQELDALAEAGLSPTAPTTADDTPDPTTDEPTVDDPSPSRARLVVPKPQPIRQSSAKG